ncbi:Phospho-2-dehydro-3-deoxyheptonate aldolase [Salmonella enterica subsp. enterica]|uniref:3-deoxy-7-phosphoheptulonate synthase n=1 Tax=Salmonella enterica I TaxID=59201 RepID=A0A3S4I6D4_SALET|nr:Phospho-2-dehydro-3-deoxyheptonate aldolase [Salmonella enterica subsp. enterica]
MRFFPEFQDYSVQSVKARLHYLIEEIDWRDCIHWDKYGNTGINMNYQNDDLRIKEINELLPPVALLEKFPATENAANTVAHARKAIHKILKGNDDRLLVVIGPCSIHDPAAAKEYAGPFAGATR